MVAARHLAERGYGPLRIRQELGRKGLDHKTIEKTLICCGDENTQEHSARRMLIKKAPRLSREANLGKRRQIAFRLLAGRGFSSTVIKRAIKDI